MTRLPPSGDRTYSAHYWETMDPIIAPGIIAIERETGRYKMGVGANYLATPYVSTSADTCEQHGHHHAGIFSHRWLRWLSLGLLFHVGLEFSFEIFFHLFGERWFEALGIF